MIGKELFYLCLLCFFFVRSCFSSLSNDERTLVNFSRLTHACFTGQRDLLLTCLKAVRNYLQSKVLFLQDYVTLPLFKYTYKWTVSKIKTFHSATT